MAQKANVLVVGCGGVGAMAAYNLEAGGQARVTAVLRSNYEAVEQHGFNIDSIDHGIVKAWKPTQITKAIPDVEGSNLKPYDYIILATKNVPDIDPDFPSTITQAVTKETSILLLQNGLNIEKPFQHCFSSSTILSGISLISATETSPGNILHDDPDRLIVGSFTHDVGREAAERFTMLYAASGKVRCEHAPDVRRSRWEKLVYNASYNSACAIVGLDTARMRLFGFPVDYLIRPLMEEIVKVARAEGVILDAELIERMINVDRMDSYFKPSMLQDVEKGNYIEYETIVGEPLREAERLGVDTPSLRLAYGMLKCLQWKFREKKGSRASQDMA